MQDHSQMQMQKEISINTKNYHIHTVQVHPEFP